MRGLVNSLAALALGFGLASCDGDDGGLRIGTKNFGESRILAEMMAALAEEQGIPVEGVVEYATTQAILEALKRGDIDAYAEYNGTALVMLGQNPTPDGEEATARVKELYEPLGLSFLGRFGFENNYGIIMPEAAAEDAGITTISDLVVRAPRMTLAVEDDFPNRPLDGLQPLLTRYAMEFGATEVVPLDERGRLYDLLIDGKADVIEGYTTDGQIADYGLRVLQDDLEFFPVYEAAPLVRADALARFDGLGAALGTVAGKIDNETMRDLNRKVEIEGRDARAVARDALARLGLIDAGAVEAADPLVIAADAPFAEGPVSAATLRAGRKAFEGRDVQIAAVPDPLAAVGAGDARLAVVGADAFFDISTPAPTLTTRFEAVAPVGEAFVHIVAPRGAEGGLAAAKRLAVGPAGSSSARVARTLVSGLGLADVELIEIESGAAADLIAAVKDGNADAAVVVTIAGDAAVDAVFSVGGLTLLPVEGWKEGANLVRFPYLREARLAAQTYQGVYDTVDTLRMQMVLAGPAPQTGDAVGDQGPSAIASGLSPISGGAVLALNAAIPGLPGVDPALPQAAALAPELPQAPAAMNPDPDISILSVAFVLFLIWLVWLYARPEYR